MYKQYEPYIEFQNPFQSTQFFAEPGDKLRVKHDLYDHVGTMGYNGLIYAGSRKSGKVTAVTPDVFSAGKMIINEGFVGNRTTAEVIQTYEALMEKEYCVISSNCEHTDNYARGLGWRSEQVQNAIYSIGAGLLLGAVIVTALRKGK